MAQTWVPPNSSLVGSRAKSPVQVALPDSELAQLLVARLDTWTTLADFFPPLATKSFDENPSLIKADRFLFGYGTRNGGHVGKKT